MWQQVLHSLWLCWWGICCYPYQKYQNLTGVRGVFGVEQKYRGLSPRELKKKVNEREEWSIGNPRPEFKACSAMCTQAHPKLRSDLWSHCLPDVIKKTEELRICLETQHRNLGLQWRSGNWETIFFRPLPDFWEAAVLCNSESIKRINDENLMESQHQAVLYKSAHQSISDNTASQITLINVLRQTIGSSRLSDYHSFQNASIYL